MSAFVDNVITDAGRALLAQVQAGATFTPTKIVMGSGYLPSGTTSRTLTDVVTPEQTLSISKKELGPDSTFIVGGVYSNQDVSKGFYWRELGLYAKAVPSGGSAEGVDEVLYSYGNAGDTADFMAAYTSGNAVERQINLITYIGNDAHVDLTIESSVYVTVEMINKPNGVPGLDAGGHIDITILPPEITNILGGGFIEMTESLPVGDRKDDTLYGLVLVDFSAGDSA